MTKIFQHLTVTILVVLAFSSLATAQQVQAEKIPVKLQIVISRYDGDRKVSSLPYTFLAVANGGQATLFNGANVTISTTTSTDGKSANNFTYTNIGTTITGTVTTDAGRFKVALLIDDKSVINTKPTTATATGNGSSERPTFSSFNFNSTVSLKEGESKQIASAADRISNEVVKVDVTLTLDK